jgi:hypothetical protein
MTIVPRARPSKDRFDLGLIAEMTWGIAAIVPFVSFVYVLTGDGFR